jgi:uncharacterized protein (DUF302 family)
MIRKMEIERFSLTSSKPFDQVLAALNAAIGHPDMAEFGRSTREARSFAELKSAVEKGLSKAGLMLFMQLDQGAVLQKETGQAIPRIIRLLIGNPLIMKEMAKHVPDAGSYAPVTVLVESGLMACICRMTEWRVCWLPIRILMPWRSPGIWIRKSKICCSKLLAEQV